MKSRAELSVGREVNFSVGDVPLLHCAAVCDRRSEFQHFALVSIKRAPTLVFA